MSLRPDEHPLTPEDEALVQRLRDGYAAPPMTSARRQAFQTRLDERLTERRRSKHRPWLVLAPTALAALAWMLVTRVPLEHGGPVTAPAIPAAEEMQALGSEREIDEALLAMVNGSNGDQDQPSDALPEDYEAIESFFLEG